MREPRNPFRLRNAEQIESDVSFLRLFGPGMLDVLPSETLWNRPVLLRSSAGGGKTSLLKLLTPTALLALHANRAYDEFSELFQRLVALGVTAEDGPRVLGVLHPCTRNYANIEDLGFEPSRQVRLFFGLLASRLVLASLRASLELHQLSYPGDLARLSIAENVDFLGSTIEGGPPNGEGLHRWATELESAVCDALDSFEPFEIPSLPGQDTLDILNLLKPGALQIDGKPVAERIVVLLDDVQYLTHAQRSSLLQALARLRSGVPTWVAERFEALAIDDLLSSGAVYGRDYEVIQIEQFWRSRRKKFENLALNAGDRRARASVEVEISSLAAHLDVSLDGTEWQNQFGDILTEVRARVRSDVAGQTNSRIGFTTRI